MKSKWIISITAGWAQTHSIKRCKEMGFNVLSVDENPNAVGFKFSDEYLVSKIDDLDKIINYVDTKKITPSGIIGFVSDAAIIPVGMLREYFQLPSQNLDLLQTQIDKERLIDLLKNNEIKIPDSFVITDFEDSKNLFKNIDTPFISKPTFGSGSRGVNKIETKNELKKIKDSFLYSKNNRIIIQEFIKGEELSIETFCHKKEVEFLAISKREINDALSATDIFTYEVDKYISLIISKEIEKIYKIFEYPDGPGHFELILDKNSNIKIIDVHFRGGGFDIYNYLVKEVSGFDIVRNTIMQCLNHKINLNYDKEKNSVYIKFLSGHKGVLKKIDGIEGVKKMGKVKMKTFYEIGEKIHHNNSDSERIVMLTCIDENIDSCKKLINEAVKKINIKIQ